MPTPVAAATDSLTVGLCSAGEIWGGVELAVKLLASGLRARGVDAVGILFHQGRLAEQLRQAGIPVIVVPMAHKYSPRAPRQVASALQKHRVDLLHVHGYKAGIIGGLAAARVGTPVVKTEHGAVEAPGGWRELPGWMRLVVYNRVDRLVTRRVAGAVVAVCSERVPSLRSRGGPPVHLIHNGVILPAPSALRPTRDRFTLGIVGRVTSVKGHPTLFKALQQLHDPGTAIHVLGTGPREAEYRRLALAMGLGEQIIFRGFCSDIAAALRQVDAVVMPSVSEGLPFALLEAMSLGLPVIASAVGGICDVVEDGVNGLLVPPGDPTRLSAAIALLRDDRDLALRLGNAGRARVQARFSVDGMVDQHISLYRQVLADHAAGRR